MNGKYILRGIEREVVEVNDLLEWAQFMETGDRIVKQEQVFWFFLVSTVFLGLDHRFTGEGPPILFETMIFFRRVGPEEWTERCSTYPEALLMHETGVIAARKMCLSPKFWFRRLVSRHDWFETVRLITDKIRRKYEEIWTKNV